jgi:hypothetical protein
MVYAFECADCQVRVYSASPKRARGCPLCDRAMTAHPVSAAAPDPAARIPPPEPPLHTGSPNVAPPGLTAR